MKTTFDEPVPNAEYLKTYGGFLLHCGAAAMGVPGAGDSHPLHGELPNIPYDTAYIETGEDEGGAFITVGGTVKYRVGFSKGYIAEPSVKFYRDASVAQVNMRLTNLRTEPMEYMYLCHINFRPFEGAQLIYSAPADAGHIKIFKDMPDNMPASRREKLLAYMGRVAAKPAAHHIIDASSQIYDPEIVLAVKYNADSDGYAHCLQVMPEGDACYAAFRPEELPIGLRWIARTSDKDAMGMLLPATGNHKGYSHAKENGMLHTIPAHGSVTFHMSVGYLRNEDAAHMQALIQNLI
jgi:hypothetical protein